MIEVLSTLSIGVGIIVISFALALLLYALDLRSHPNSPSGLLYPPAFIFLIGAALVAWPFLGG